jgi:hypothetical protein
MRTRIVKENGAFNVYHDGTNTLLGSRPDHEAAKEFAATMRGLVKAEAAKVKIAELGDGGADSDLLILEFGGEQSPITADLRFFEDEIANLSASPLLDSNGNDVPRTYREGFVLRPGEFVDANGREVRITPDHIARIHRNHDPSYPPKIQLQHRGDPRDTQGYVPLTTVHGTGDATELHVALEFRGREAVDKAEAGLYRDLSAGINMRTWTLEEVSVVGKGAVGATGGKRAQIKFSTNTNNGATPQKEQKPMSFLAKLWGAMVRDRRAEAATKNESITLAAGVTEADLAAMEKGEVAVLDRDKVLATAATLGLDEEGVKRFLLALEADGALSVAPATPTPDPNQLDLSAVPPAVLAMFKAQEAEIATLKASREADAIAARTSKHQGCLASLMAAGKLPPSEEKPMLALFAKMEDAEVEMVLGRLGMQPAEIRFGRASMPDIAKPPTGTTTPEEASKEALLNLSAVGFKFEDGKIVDPSAPSLSRS